MAIIKFEYGEWNSIMGYTCDQCGVICPFMEGALQHEKHIEENNGECPDK